MPDTIYVMELKVHGAAQDALNQINEHGYSIPYHSDHRKVVKAGLKFEVTTRALEDWVIE